MPTAIEGAMRTYLLAQPSIAALVDTRIYSEFLPQPVGRMPGPSIVYNRISTTLEHHLTAEQSKLDQAVIQYDCYGNSKDEAFDLLAAVRNNTDHVGPLDLGAPYTYVHIMRQNELDLSASWEAGSEEGLFRRMIELLVTFREAFIRS